MGTFLAGLRSRRWLNVGVIALGALAMLAAVAGPLYARASAEHLLDQRTEQRLQTETGLHFEVLSPAEAEDPERRGARRLDDSDRAVMLDIARSLMDTPEADAYWLPTTRYLISDGEMRLGLRPYQIKAYWRQGMCERAEVVGECPDERLEALADPVMLRTLRKEIGDTITVIFEDTVSQTDGSQTVKEFPADYTVVGTYTIDDAASPYWFDPGRTGGDASLRPPAAANAVPQAPALLVHPSSIDMASSSVAGADRPIDLSRLDIATMPDVQAQLVAWQASVIGGAGPQVTMGEELASLDVLFDDVRREQVLLSRVTLAAVVPLIVLALVLLYVLVAAAAEVRRPEVALAKLRGFSEGRVLRFAVAEPVVLLLVAIPLGVAGAVVAERVTGRWLLGPTPFVVTTPAVASGVAVAAAALTASFVAMLGVAREPLVSSLGATRRRRSSRWSVLGQGALVMLAVAAVAQVVTSDATRSSSVVELLTPLFVSLGGAVLAMLAIGVLARAWASRTADRGGLGPFLAARRLVRRQDLAQLVLPLMLATAMATFAASSWQVADDWRVSRAAASVGADTLYRTEASPTRLTWASRQADPDGRYLAAALPPIQRGTDGGRVTLVDAERFAAVTAWDDAWGDASPDDVQAWLLGDRRPDPVTFSGASLTAEVTDIDLEGELNVPVELWVRYLSDGLGEQRLAKVGSLPMRGDVRITGTLSECDQGCELQQLYVSGSSSSVSDAFGELTIASLGADGDAGVWRLTDEDAWRPARPFGTSGTSPVALTPGPDGLRLSISEGEATVVRITTNDIPAAPPLVATESTALEDGPLVEGASLIGTRTPMELAGRTLALPTVGQEGGLSDLEPALREYGDLVGTIPQSYLLVAVGTPPSVIEDVRDLGISLPEEDRITMADELSLLRDDAFSLGWRVFLLVGALTLLLAFLGVLALAVVQLRWRAYEVAALRVVGVRRRDLRRAIVTEYVALLGMAVVGGALAATTSLLLVLPSLDIGEPGAYDPAVDYALRWPVLAGVVVMVLVVVLAIAWWIARRTVVLGTPATLRQADAR